MLRSGVILASLIFPLLSMSQVIGTSQYQSPVTTGYWVNGGRITNQHGEARPDVLAAFQGNRFQAFFHTNGWEYQTSQLNKPDTERNFARVQQLLEQKNLDTFIVSRVQMDWLSTLGSGDYRCMEPYGPPTHVYRENFSQEELRAHRKMLWTNAFEGIQFEFSWVHDKRIKYNILVDAGVDIQQLRCVISGAENVRLTENGKTIEILTGTGLIKEHIPLSWQIKPDGSKQPLEVIWSLHGDTAGFSLPENYDSRLPLVIDPWSTYLGGTGGGNYEYGEDISTDAALNVFATGTTTSLFNIATTGTFQTTLSGTEDAYLIRYNSNGSRQWCTYYGGVATDYAGGVSSLGSAGLFMVMSTYNTGLATSGTYQQNQQGAIDVLLCRMNPVNGQRIWATYYGGAFDDFAQGIQIDASGNVYITGTTTSNGGIATTGAFKTTLAFNDQDAFVARFSSGGARTWATYYGGGNIDSGFDITIDVSGNVLIGGYTFSTANIATAGTHQTTLRGVQDAFLARFNAAGSRLWGTYFGGNQDENIHAVATDALGRIYAAGYTSSSTFIATPGAFKTALTGTNDGFLFRLNTNGTMNYSTYYGGENDDVVYGIKTDALNNTYFCGYTTSSTGIATTGADKTTLSGTSDGFTGKFNNAGSRLWCTYYGGPDFEFCRNLALDAAANVIITGYTSSTSGIAVNAAQNSLTGFVNAFIAKYTTNGILPVTWQQISATPVNQDILIQWGTSTEINNEYFTVEHSVDGDFFLPLDRISGAGHSSTLQTYQYRHEQPGAGIHYYRIRQTDFNGTYDYSTWVTARIDYVKKNYFLLSNEAYVSISSDDKAFDRLDILHVTNSSGMAFQVQSIVNNGLVSFSTRDFAPGVYAVTFMADNQLYTLKFIR